MKWLHSLKKQKLQKQRVHSLKCLDSRGDFKSPREFQTNINHSGCKRGEYYSNNKKECNESDNWYSYIDFHSLNIEK